MILIFDPDRRFRTRAAKELDAHDQLLAAGEAAEFEELLARDHRDFDVAVMGPNLEPALALATADRIQRRTPEVSVLLVTSHLSQQLLVAALRSGVKDVLADSCTPEEFRSAVERASLLARQLRGRNGVSGNGADGIGGRVISVFSSKGGCGKSVVASNLSILLAEMTEKDVALVDLDLQSGDLAIMLAVTPSWTILDAAGGLEGLDDDALRGYMTQHSSGVWLLPAPLDPSQAESISAPTIQRILKQLRHAFHYVVVDLTAFYNDQTIAALDESDVCVLVGSLDIPSIKGLKLSLHTLAEMGLGRDRLRLVLNRADSRVGLSRSEVEKSLGTEIDIALPSSVEVPQSVNRGMPLALDRKKSSVVAPITRLAAAVALAEPAGKRGTKGRMGSIGRGRVRGGE